MNSLIRIFFLLFLPIFFWAGYSFYPNNLQLLSYELPKMEKVELLSYSVTHQKQSHKSEQIVCKKEIIVQNKNQAVGENEIEKTKGAIQVTSLVSNIQIEPNEAKKQKIAIDLEDMLLENNTSQLKVLVLGDSMGEGIAYGLSQLKKRYPIRYKSFAKASTTTFYWNSELLKNKEIENFAPDIVLIALGTNEWNGVGSATKLRILKIYNKLESMGLKSVWVTPPVCDANKFYEMVYDVYGNHTYDSRMINLPRGPDKIHPTMKGYITWADDILQAVQVRQN